MCRDQGIFWAGQLTLAGVLLASAFGANQTASTSPIQIGGLSYTLDLQVANVGSHAYPTLQTFASGVVGREWLLVGGRTNGLHGFGPDPNLNFPDSRQNTTLWVVDSVTKQTWARDLPSDLAAPLFNALSSVAVQHSQEGSSLYLAGGYLRDVTTDPGNPRFTTLDTLTVIDLPAAMDWVKTGTGALSSSLRQVSDPLFQLTGGAMHISNGEGLLIFGANFTGGYPGGETLYSKAVRTFQVNNTGASLEVQAPPVDSFEQDPAFRRRDLNVVPIVTDGDDPKIVALAGVFTETGGAWTVPVEIFADGDAIMAAAEDPNTFKQGMNGYHSSTVSFYSPSAKENHIALLGGISLQTNVDGLFVTDDELPFTSQSSVVVRGEGGSYSQHYLGDVFPEIPYPDSDKPQLLGAGSTFFVNPELAMVEDAIDLDQLSGRTFLGHVFGGIAARDGNRGPSRASGLMFEVWYQPIPEPGTWALLALAAAGWIGSRPWRRG